ncbi:MULTISPECIES: complement resistance protein TraT [Helicobacter]|uniref:Complement resistance protein TraT n=1 Tax=Helicobacter ibis TaxID=2962633 RepID=A0ABT4VEZ9_9HELI|nr:MULTISPECIES: complement resistance protein TraT [Helicobacter]MDA3967043.1 complement resistance protein TraT [Helicobacter sp. WB40]MDA3969177.1 complement resistance protein TraT [Helicobacter ibis]
MIRIFSVLAFFIFLLSGCATNQVQSNVSMTNSIFIDPVHMNDRVIFISVSNTSGEYVNLKPKLVKSLENMGYLVTNNPNEAVFILQTNILYCNVKREENTADGAIIGGAIGAGIGGYNSGATGAVLSGLAGATLGALLGHASEDTIIQMQVDVSIKQINNYGHYTQRQTTMIAEASRRNLQLGEIVNMLEDRISSQISGIFRE